jgi:large subunit ribosomal protein L10
VTELNRDEKAQVVAAIADRLERTETVLAADFRGLTVAELAELRQRLREAEAEMAVVKNTLSRRAADQTGRAALVPYLQGPTGLVWVDGDPARAAKALSDFAKTHQEVFSIRGGVLGAEDLPAASIVRLASLPSRDQLLAQLAGAVASPLSGLAGRLGGLVGNLARTLAAVRDAGSLAAGETPPAAAAGEPAAEEAPDAPVAEDPAADEPREDAVAVEAPLDEAPAADAEDAPADDANEPSAETPADEPSGGASADEQSADDSPAAGESTNP